MAHTISVGYARTQTKETIVLFDEENESDKGIVETKSRRGRIDKDKKQNELNELQELFKK